MTELEQKAEEYISDLVLTKYTESDTIPNIRQRFYSYNDMIEIFNAGVESVNKRISDVNKYYQQLESMSEEYQKGYIQAEKDMPKQFEAIHDIIRLQKRIDELKAQIELNSSIANSFQYKICILEKENAELKEQLEKMKCCENCKWCDTDCEGHFVCTTHIFFDCKSNKLFDNKDSKINKWELAE